MQMRTETWCQPYRAKLSAAFEGGPQVRSQDRAKKEAETQG